MTGHTRICILSLGMKGLRWEGSSRKDARAFPKDARKRAGYELYRVQVGEPASDWRVMPSVGAGVNEIRIHTKREHRVLYIAKFEEAIYVLHAFEKKTRKTTKADIQLGKSRLKTLLERRRVRERTRRE